MERKKKAMWNPWYLSSTQQDNQHCRFCGSRVYSGWTVTKRWRRSNWTDNFGKTEFSCWLCLGKKAQKKNLNFVEVLGGEVNQVIEYEPKNTVKILRQKPRRGRPSHAVNL